MACPTIYAGDYGAQDIVNSGYNTYRNYAETAFQGALDFVDELERLSTAYLPPVNTSVTYDPALTSGGDFQVPTAPADINLTFQMPTLGFTPSSAPPSLPTFDTAPEFTVDEPQYNAPVKPDALDVLPPGDAPTVGDVTIPDTPSITLPDVPTLREITLPETVDLTLPTWDEVAPDSADIQPPSGSFVWAEPDYEGKVMDEVTAEIQRMLQGGTGLPNEIWDQIWDRARRNLAEQRDAAIEEATERWADRGWAAPGGALNKQIDRAITEFNRMSAEQLRETAIKQAELEIQNLQFAVSQGIALETQYLNYFNSVAQRSIEAARLVHEIAIQIFQAKIAKYNADVQVYAVKAEVHKTLIDAELARLEEYKQQLEGQKLIGELNVQDVQIYATQVDAVTKEIDLFRAQLEGVQAQVEVDRTRVGAYAETVSAYGERVKAHALEYEAYNTQVQAELAKVEVYKAQTDAFSSRVQAYNTGVQAEVAKSGAEIAISEHELAKFRGYLEKYKAEVQGETARIASETQLQGTKVDVYRAETDAEKLRLDYVQEQNRLAINDAQNEAELRLKSADLNIEQLYKNLAIQQEALRTLANVQSQLAASALNAVSISASVSGSGSYSTSYSSSCSQSF